MTVRQLKEELSKYPDNMNVFMAERQTEFKYGLLNGVYNKEIILIEDPNAAEEDDEDSPRAYEKVVILDEE
jgi:7-cyano-7-deazaguanine synthase in queuosine biosynthesis